MIQNSPPARRLSPIAFRGLALSLCLLAPLPGFAQEDRAERLAVAKDYVAATMMDMDMSRIVKQMWQPLVQQIEAGTGKALSQGQLDQIDALYQETFAEKMRGLMSQQDEVMADLLTLAEIEALRDFYATPEGRAVMVKMPDIIAKQQPVIMEMVQSTLPTLMPKLRTIVEGQ